MTLSEITAQVRQKTEDFTLASKLGAEYQRNAEVRFALDHLGFQSVSNVLNRKLDGPNPKQRTDADIAREKPFRLISDREVDAYGFETTIREGFAHSPIPTKSYNQLEPYVMLRFFETIFPREELGVDAQRLAPLQEVHKNFMKKVYEGKMAWDELTALVQQHKDLKHLSGGFNVTNRLEAFVRNEAATEFLHQLYGEVGTLAMTMDASPLRAARRIVPGKSNVENDPHETNAAQLKHFALGKFTKEEDLLLGAIIQDKKMLKKFSDTLTTYQFLINATAFEDETGQPTFFTSYIEKFRKEIDILLTKIVEHGGEKHTMSERYRMKQVLLGWLESLETFSRESIGRAKLALESLTAGGAFSGAAAPLPTDLWASF